MVLLYTHAPTKKNLSRLTESNIDCFDTTLVWCFFLLFVVVVLFYPVFLLLLGVISFRPQIDERVV